MNEGQVLIDEWLTEDGLELLAAYARDGMTILKIAEKIGITQRQLYRWKSKYPEINKALSKGAELIDYKVENALLSAALGKQTKETRVLMRLRQGKMTAVEQETTIKEIPPNISAIKLWLNNRHPEKWKRNADNILSADDKDNNITVNIIKHGEVIATANSSDACQEDDKWDEEWEDEKMPANWTEVNESKPSKSTIIKEDNLNEKNACQLDGNDDWEEEYEEYKKLSQPIKVDPLDLTENLQVKNTDKEWKTKGRYNHKGVIKSVQKGGHSLEELAKQSNTVDEWDREEETW